VGIDRLVCCFDHLVGNLDRSVGSPGHSVESLDRVGWVDHSVGSLDRLADQVVDHHSVGSLDHLVGILDHSVGSLDHSVDNLDHLVDSLAHLVGSLDHRFGSFDHSSMDHSTMCILDRSNANRSYSRNSGYSNSIRDFDSIVVRIVESCTNRRNRCIDCRTNIDANSNPNYCGNVFRIDDVRDVDNSRDIDHRTNKPTLVPRRRP